MPTGYFVFDWKAMAICVASFFRFAAAAAATAALEGGLADFLKEDDASA